MWHFVLRMLIVLMIALMGIKCVSINVFGPMLTGYILLIVAGAWLLVELIMAVEQIVNACKRRK